MPQGPMPSAVVSDGAREVRLTGEDVAQLFLPLVRACAESLDDDDQRLLWWAPLFACLGGACAASIGPEALRAIEQTTARLVGRVLAEKMQ